VAYVAVNTDTGRDEDSDAPKIVARAVCWPERKVFDRVYGNEYMLEKVLTAAGYSQGSLEGARMLREEYNGGFVVPYVDHVLRADDDGKHLILRRHGDVDCETQTGLSSPTYCCDNCGDGADEEDSTYIEDCEESWCRSCTDQNAFHCDRTDRTRSGESVAMANGETWCTDAFARHGFTCEGTGLNCSRDDGEFIVLLDGTVWSHEYFDANGFQCCDCSECFDNDDAHATRSWLCAVCGDALDKDEGVTADGDAAPPRRPPQGRDENPAQVELPLLPPGALQVLALTNSQGLSDQIGYIVQCAPNGIVACFPNWTRGHGHGGHEWYLEPHEYTLLTTLEEVA